MMKTLQRGFTLIELLVVIAIIGILAAVVLASLNDARDGGQDASIKQSMSNIRSQAELIYNRDGYTYATVCTDPNVDQLLEAAVDNRSETTGINLADTTSASNIVTCHDTDSGYAVSAPLNIQYEAAEQHWCIDSSGWAGTTTPAQLGGTDDITCN